jgi:hypothetical protein
MSVVVPVPDTLDEALSPEWLTRALGHRFPGVEVVTVTAGPVVSRVSTNARFTIECAGGVPEGLSPNLCVKGYFTPSGRAFRATGEPEACFYRDIAGTTGMRTLRSVYADVDETTRHGVIITEDVALQGATFLDALSDYTIDQTAASLEELARLHAATWCDRTLEPAPWLAPRFALYLAVRGVDEIRGNFTGPIGAGVPDIVRDAERLVEAYGSLATVASAASPWSVIHGDPHIGNVYVDAARRPSFVDWQLVQRGPWYLDVGYHIASAVDVEDRRRAERDLVQHYLEQLGALGVAAPSGDDVWLGIRRGIVHGFFLWGITLKVDPAITRELLTRLGTAAADHDAFAAVAA